MTLHHYTTTQLIFIAPETFIGVEDTRIKVSVLMGERLSKHRFIRWVVFEKEYHQH
jgi:hypothetical protein